MEPTFSRSINSCQQMPGSCWDLGKSGKHWEGVDSETHSSQSVLSASSLHDVTSPPQQREGMQFPLGVQEAQGAFNSHLESEFSKV